MKLSLEDLGTMKAILDKYSPDVDELAASGEIPGPAFTPSRALTRQLRLLGVGLVLRVRCEGTPRSRYRQVLVSGAVTSCHPRAASPA
jgi:hypothetical protein